MNSLLKCTRNVLGISAIRNFRTNPSAFKLSSLSNGLRVASISHPSMIYSAIAIFSNVGSVDTKEYPTGITKVIERMAFSGSENYKDSEEITKYSGLIGGIPECEIGREHSYHAFSILPEYLVPGVHLLFDCAHRPKFTNQQFELSKTLMTSHLSQQKYQKTQIDTIYDALMKAAYGNHGLGLPLIPTVSSLGEMTLEHVNKFIKSYYTADRTYLFGLNVNHDKLVDAARQVIVFDESSLKSPSREVSNYVGGSTLIHDPNPRAQPGNVQLPELDNLAIGFPCCTIEDTAKYAALMVLQSLFGQAESFSIGGPGKGLHQRLSMNLLKKYHFVESAHALIESSADSSVFYLFGSCHRSKDSSYILELANCLLEEYFKVITTEISDDELLRTKNQLKSYLSREFEKKGVLFSSFAKNIVSMGDHIDNRSFFQYIDQVRPSDLKSICREMLSSSPSCAAMGDLSNLPDYDTIQKSVNNLKPIKKSIYNNLF